MTPEPDGGLTVHLRDVPPDHRGSSRLFLILAIVALVACIIACTAFIVAMLVLRSEQNASEQRDERAAMRDQEASRERAALSAELQRIRVEAAAALGEQQCRSLAFARQNAVESEADVIALELLTEVVDQTFRSARGEQIQFAALERLMLASREATQAERVANVQYRQALDNCHQ